MTHNNLLRLETLQGKAVGLASMLLALSDACESGDNDPACYDDALHLLYLVMYEFGCEFDEVLADIRNTVKEV